MGGVYWRNEMKAKKGIKILGTVLGAAAISMTVICCYAPSGDIRDIGETGDGDYIEQIAAENSQLVTFDDDEKGETKK